MKREAGYLAMLAFLFTGLRFMGGPAAVKETPQAKAEGQTVSVFKMPAHEDTSCKAFDYPPLPTVAGIPEKTSSKSSAGFSSSLAPTP